MSANRRRGGRFGFGQPLPTGLALVLRSRLADPPAGFGDTVLVSMLHDQAIVNQESYQEDGVYLEAYIPHHLMGAVKQYQWETVEEL